MTHLAEPKSSLQSIFRLEFNFAWVLDIACHLPVDKKVIGPVVARRFFINLGELGE